MIWTFILGIAAGWGAPYIEEQLKAPLEKLLATSPILPTDMRAVSVTLCLLVAAIWAMITGSSHVLPLTLGACIGVLGPRFWEKFRAMRAPDYDS